MKLIADSGATKSDWVLIDKSGERMSFQLWGMNPFYIGSDKIIEILAHDIVPFTDQKKISEIHFYGAGCSSANKKMMIEEAIQNVFKNSMITVESDSLGAARALFGNKEGLACILGTGSNSCYYDGQSIVKTLPSLGYFFADEVADFTLDDLHEILAKIQVSALHALVDARRSSRDESVLGLLVRWAAENSTVATWLRSPDRRCTHADPNLWRDWPPRGQGREIRGQGRQTLGGVWDSCPQSLARLATAWPRSRRRLTLSTSQGLDRTFTRLWASFDCDRNNRGLARQYS